MARSIPVAGNTRNMHRVFRNLRGGLLRVLAIYGLMWMVLGGVSTGQAISTVAGGDGVDLGDGGLATEANLSNPADVFVDDTGRIYIVDQGNDRIRRVETTGYISTLAGGADIDGGGTTAITRTGDGGPATDATFRPYGPYDLFVDGSGSLYVVNWGVIRKVNTAGIISKIGGKIEVGGAVGDGRVALEANVWPQGVFKDSKGNLYIADAGHNRVRKVDAATGIINTIAGTGEADFSGDWGKAYDARLDAPESVFVDGDGTLYIADTGNHRIRKVDAAGVITTVAGSGTMGFSGDGGPAADASLNFPKDIFEDSVGNLYIADTLNHRIRKVDPSGTITTVAGNGHIGFSGDGGPATEASLWEPGGIAVDGLGNVYIADTTNQRIRKVTASLKIGVTADPGTIAADGVATSVIQAEILNPDDLLLHRNNVTQVRFEILEGEGDLSVKERKVTGGVVVTDLTSRKPGRVTVQASAEDAGIAVVSVEIISRVSPEAARASDFTGDGTVGFDDFLAFSGQFGNAAGDTGYDLKFDLDSNGQVGFSDFLIFVQSFGGSVESGDNS